VYREDSHADRIGGYEWIDVCKIAGLSFFALSPIVQTREIISSVDRSVLKSGISFFVAVDETENGPDREQENETPIDAASPLSSVSIYIIIIYIPRIAQKY